MWIAVAAVVLFVVWFALLRVRRGGKNAPPVVTDYPANAIPIIGHLVEFFSSPNSMIKRCYQQIGPVFTIPVSLYQICVESYVVENRTQTSTAHHIRVM